MLKDRAALTRRHPKERGGAELVVHYEFRNTYKFHNIFA